MRVQRWTAYRFKRPAPPYNFAANLQGVERPMSSVVIVVAEPDAGRKEPVLSTAPVKQHTKPLDAIQPIVLKAFFSI